MRFILLVGVLMAAYFKASQSENGLSQYWEEHIGIPHPPHWLDTKASPLTLNEAAVFMELIEKNELVPHLHSFCKKANIACDMLVKKTTNNTILPPISQSNDVKVVYDRVPSGSPLLIANQGGLTFFRASMVKQGGFIHVPDLRDAMSHTSFLSQSLASKIPFSLAQIKELKNLFGVADGSEMEHYIEETLEICEKKTLQGEWGICVTSVEVLIDFVIEKLGHHVNIWSTENAEGSYENVTIGAVKLIYGNFSKPPALCHSQSFPFQVYYCHILQKVKVYRVEIHAQKKVNHAIMACHYDTSSWHPDHLAFKLMGFGPGLIEVCHWMNENGMVWTKTLG